MRNVVLICLDTVRKDYFDEYAPRIRERAEVSFEQCRAASSWSVPSHASMMTGRLPSQHGVHDHHRDFSHLSREDTFLADLPEHFATAVSANVYASSAFGFDWMFDDFCEVSPDCRFPNGMHVGRFGYDYEGSEVGKYLAFAREAVQDEYPLESLANGAAVAFERFSEWLPFPKLLDDGANIIAREGVKTVRDSPEPLFLFTNFMDAHAPLRHTFGYDRSLHSASNTWHSEQFDNWDLNQRGKEGFETNRRDVALHREVYGAAIDYLDRKVVQFVENVQAATDEETTFVITADHGENLGYEAEDYMFGHDSSLSESLLHVPLYIVNPPAGCDYDAQEQGYFSHLRLGELIVGLASGETLDVFDERIPAELVGSSNANPPGDADYWNRMLRCVYGVDGPEEKVEWDSLGDSDRYELDHDRPCWQRRVEEDVPYKDLDTEFFDEEISAYKRRAERDEAEAEGKGPDVDEATQDRLQDLGYL
jgi:arylsulfatase A-like enzyme